MPFCFICNGLNSNHISVHSLAAGALSETLLSFPLPNLSELLHSQMLD